MGDGFFFGQHLLVILILCTKDNTQEDWFYLQEHRGNAKNTFLKCRDACGMKAPGPAHRRQYATPPRPSIRPSPRTGSDLTSAVFQAASTGMCSLTTTSSSAPPCRRAAGLPHGRGAALRLPPLPGRWRGNSGSV